MGMFFMQTAVQMLRMLRGLDKTVRCTMSESMKELLRGVGVPETRVRLYGVGHWGIVMRKFLIP